MTEAGGLGHRLQIRLQDVRQLWYHRKEIDHSGEEYERWISAGLGFVTIFDPDYPQRLREIYDPPFALYVRGKLPDPHRKTAAIIGARACSGYGANYGRKIARELAAEGVQIISGLAYGIDSEGHWGALESKVPGATYAVLGCGVEQCYPREHEKLADQILQNGGGILSEFPPGTAPHAGHFPMRNRIISGLSDCILVMEARRRSGSLITVDQALEQGREVFALPGRVEDKLSEGCLHLIRNGANLLTESGDVLWYLFPEKRKNGKYMDKNVKIASECGGKDKGIKKIQIRSGELDECERKRGHAREKDFSADTEKNSVYSCLDSVEKTVEEIMTLTGLPLAAVRMQLLELLLEDQITETVKGYYSIQL
ncbi:MAG: DNA-processing protein DprA [Lachnospiraceae bacterium]|nr:DNA-processing protein DprA [Lachnospiraceae bacterium]